jgi:hypothetical protein
LTPVAVTVEGVGAGSGNAAETRAGGAGGPARRAAALAAALTVLLVPGVASGSPRVAAKLKAAGAPAGELDRVDAIRLPGGAAVYRFQQRVSGVPVLNGQAVVNDPAGAPPDLVADSSKPRIDSPPRPRIVRAAAVVRASRSTGLERLRGRISARLAIQPGDRGTLVWRVLIPAARPLGDFEVLVDAISGRVLRTRDLLRRWRRGHAKLYNPNPVVHHSSYSGLKKDRRDKNTSLLSSLRVRVVLHGIKEGQNCLRGKWVHAKVGRHPTHDVCKRSLRWNSVKRAKDRFEGLMAYFHIARAQRYIQRLGFSGKSDGINDRVQTVIADAFRDDNSFFSTATRKISYGSGGVDDAEDADVILHEYGHAMQDDQRPGFGYGLEGGAIGEGFGDYWAAAMSSRSPKTSNEDDVCIFDWDGLTWGRYVEAFHRRCGRRADRGNSVPQIEDRCGGEIHCLGEAWSSALWDLRTEYGISPIAFDRILLSSQFMYTTNEHFDEAVDALVAADQDLTGGANASEICDEMEAQRKISAAACP